MNKERETWNTHIGMILAMIGTEVGLGNIWRFPYLAGKYGGGAFLIPYLVILFGIGIFAMMAEWVIGRHTRREPLGAFQKIKFPFGRDVGAWGVIGPFFLYAYYIVITSWVIFFVAASFGRLYFGVDTEEFFLKFLSSPWIFVVHILAVTITSFILALGVQRGIEKACQFMIPTLFILLIVVAIRSVTLPGASQGIEFYMRPRWSGLLNPATWIAALGQVFFTLSLGMGAMLIYGSYLKEGWGIPANSIACALGNTSSSILAGFAIFPAAFALGFGQAVSGSQSIGLTFIIFPKIFEKMPAGWLFGGLFFILLTFGALSSAISIQEPSIAWLKDEVGWSRKKSAFLTGLLLWVMGLPFIANGYVKGGLGRKLALLSKMDIIIGQLALPFFGLLCIIAVGWFMKEKGFQEINKNARLKLGKWAKGWIKFVVPAVTILIFLSILIDKLQELGIIRKILPEGSEFQFIPKGIDLSTIIMIIVVCGLIWGGFIFSTIRVIQVEREKYLKQSEPGKK